jgi:hypothetical protein
MMIVTFGLCLTLLTIVKGDDNNVLRIDGSVDDSNEGWDVGRWYVLVDGVMGGQSTGGMEFISMSENDNELLKFTGDISLDGGGFSSVRRQISLDLNNYDGIVVTLEADNFFTGSSTSTPPTGLHLQFSDSTSYYAFSSAFAIPLSPTTSSSELTSVYLPMDSFNRGTRFGFVCRDNCELDNTNINNLSVYVLFQEGTFDVRIKSISAISKAGGPRSFLSPQIQFDSVDEIINLLQSTISSGGSLYDKTYIELCIVMYWSVLNSILNANAIISNSTKVVICSGLNEMINDNNNNNNNNSNNSKEDQAWTLRYTIDAIIADLQGLDRSTDSNNNFLPSRLEAESMDVTCVGRTSPPEGTLYDSNGTMIVVNVDDNDVDVDVDVDVDSEEDLLLEEEDIILDEDIDGGNSTIDEEDVSIQKAVVSLNDNNNNNNNMVSSPSLSLSGGATSSSSSSSSWTVLIIVSAVIGLATTTMAIL